MKNYKVDKTEVKIFETREEMGKAAACDIKNRICELLEEKEEINMIFAAAPSQNDVLFSLKGDKTIDWQKINAFHMDEYIGLKNNAPQGFGNFLKNAIFDYLPFKSVNLINAEAKNADEECERYAKLLKEKPADIVVMGIGENGHIAFNDPHVAFFDDHKAVKIVELDEICRNQQVNDGCFESLSDVPRYALTLTVPTLMAAKYHFCIVPSVTKAKAVERTLNGEISEECPASILRKKENSILYCDKDSASLL